MYCPQCKAEYREGFTHCSDCDSDLVDVIPEDLVQPEGSLYDDDGLVEILSTTELSDVILIKSILDAENVEYFLQGEELKILKPLANVTLFTRKEDAERVVVLLDDLINGTAEFEQEGTEEE